MNLHLSRALALIVLTASVNGGSAARETVEIWTKPLTGGTTAMGVFNRG
jgi:hypothetical protein